MATQPVAEEKFRFPDEVQSTPVEGTPPDVNVTVEEDDLPIQTATPEKPQEHVEPDEVTEEELATYGQRVQKRIKDLSAARRRTAEERATAEAERNEVIRVAQQIAEENKRLKMAIRSGETAYSSTLVQSATAEFEKAKQALKAAHDAYDSDAIVAAQQNLNEAQWKLASAKNFKPTPLQETPDIVQHTQRPAPGPDERTLRWQRNNQWWGEDQPMTAYALALHQQIAATKPDVVGTEDYFQQLDAQLHARFPEKFGEQQPQTPASSGGKRPASVVAPASRSSGTRQIKLNQRQVALARKIGVTPEQYAQQIALLPENMNG